MEMWVKKFGSVVVTLALAVTVVAVLTGPSEAAGKKKCRNIAHRAMYHGTENQAAGVRENARWGFTEIDARITKDGKIVALHDFTMYRPTGGRSHAPVGDLTLRQIRNKKFVLGRRVETTRHLIKVASRQRASAIMVTINSYALYKDQWDNGGLEALWKAAQKHAKPKRVFFGGYGGEKAMREAFPKARLFHRYSRNDNIMKHAKEFGVDLAGVPVKQFNKRLVRKLRRNKIWVATNQLDRKRHVRAAYRAGIRLMQTDNSRRTVRRWCP